MDPLISVIIPVYNVENELTDCIESIIMQTYSNIEIVLINDGSTDSSGDICNQYAQKDSRIVALHKKNGGLSDARNYGIAHSKGEFIICVDSDDIAKNTLIENLFSLVQSKNAQIAVCPYQKFNDSSQLFEDNCVETGVVSQKEALIQLLYQSKVIHTGAHCKLYARWLFDDIQYPVGMYYEDLATTYRLIAKSSKIAYTTEKMYGYRIREQSILRQSFSQKKMSCIPISIALYSDLCHLYPDLQKAAASRAFNVNRSVYLQIPSKMKKERNLVWAEMKKYRVQIIKDHNARKRDRVLAFCSYFGQPFFILLSVPYRKQQMGLK